MWQGSPPPPAGLHHPSGQHWHKSDWLRWLCLPARGEQCMMCAGNRSQLWNTNTFSSWLRNTKKTISDVYFTQCVSQALPIRKHNKKYLLDKLHNCYQKSNAMVIFTTSEILLGDAMLPIGNSLLRCGQPMYGYCLNQGEETISKQKSS
jgi:hypothetical protein